MADVTQQIAQARTLMEVFLRFNPSSDDKASVDEKLVKCQGLYDAENVIDLPLITHVASQICFDELIQKLNDMIAKYRGGAVIPLTPSTFPWWGYVGIAVGGLAVVGGLFAAFAPRGPVVITQRGKAA